MESIVVEHLRKTYRELYKGGANVSLQTKASIAITKSWQNKLVAIDADRYIGEYVVNSAVGSRSHKIDLYDADEKIAYELKVSANNPHHEFYKDIFKVAFANRDDQIVRKLVFCCPEIAYEKLGELAEYAITQAPRLGFEVSIVLI